MGDVTDPTDFGAPTLPTTVPSTLSHPLGAIDAALRCRVCKDLFATPMITSCSHTFCSLCIRRCLSADGRCPVCRAEDQVMRLRRNWAIEELVEGWKDGRRGVLDGLKSLGSARQMEVELEGNAPNKRRKISHNTEKAEESFSGRSTRSRTRRAIQSSQEEAEQSSSQPIEIVADSEDNDSSYEDEIRVQGQKPSIRNNNAPSSQSVPEDGLVACPGCGKRMKEESVFAHLDRCTSLGGPGSPPPSERPVQKNSFMSTLKPPVSTPTPPPQTPLPTINYNLLNDKALRKKFKDLGIPDWGPKLLLQRRHTEWVNLWNANCDARHPRTKRELLQELDVWERTQGGYAQTSAAPIMLNGANNSSNANIGEKEFDKQEWSKSHQDDFKELIRKAREKRAAAVAATAKPDSGNISTEQSATSTAPTESVFKPEQNGILVIDSATPSNATESITLAGRPEQPTDEQMNGTTSSESQIPPSSQNLDPKPGRVFV